MFNPTELFALEAIFWSIGFFLKNFDFGGFLYVPHLVDSYAEKVDARVWHFICNRALPSLLVLVSAFVYHFFSCTCVLYKHCIHFATFFIDAKRIESSNKLTLKFLGEIRKGSKRHFLILFLAAFYSTAHRVLLNSWFLVLLF